jgi:hypothetical protein
MFKKMAVYDLFEKEVRKVTNRKSGSQEGKDEHKKNEERNKEKIEERKNGHYMEHA